jgi:hypothetical protein
VRGRIEIDDGRGDLRTPVIIIDGHRFTWKKFGAMLSTFEGWDLKLQILDASE